MKIHINVTVDLENLMELKVRKENISGIINELLTGYLANPDKKLENKADIDAERAILQAKLANLDSKTKKTAKKKKTDKLHKEREELQQMLDEQRSSGLEGAPNIINRLKELDKMLEG